MISVIVPYYNTEKYFKECLSSIKGQTFSDFEVLLINDGSTDGCFDIAKSFAEEDSRFRLLGGTHVGFPQAKNIGLDEARGEYIAFVDSDDYVEPDYLEVLYNLITSTGSDIATCGHIDFTGHCPMKDREPIDWNPDIQVYEDDKMSQLLSWRVRFFMWNKIYKKELFNDIRFPDAIALSDVMVMYRLFDKAGRVASTRQELIHYRMHMENMTHRVVNEPTYWEHRLKVFADMVGFICERYPQSADVAKGRFQRELLRVRPHLDEETYGGYLDDISSRGLT